MNKIQTEAQLEHAFVSRLTELGWQQVKISDSATMEDNLRAQLGAHNNTTYSDGEFRSILNHLSKGSVFDKSKTLRDRMTLQREDGSTTSVQFFNSKEWCKNSYQVTTQVSQVGSYKNRYDVTLLVNGLPLVHTELKRRGMELREAFNQINRYQKQSFWTGHALFQYVQVFVISNGVNTKYYANNKHQDFKQTFSWTDAENKPFSDLESFTDAFLEKCFISKMIARYVVQHESTKVLMVLRPYQYYAVERILDRVTKGRKNGYIWHTTGSGKTLTSFKSAQLIIQNPKVAKTIFVVDRADLDYQTRREFNEFSPGSVDPTDNTKSLVDQLLDDDAKLVVTTIQKLNSALTKPPYKEKIKGVLDKRVVFVFDECHRSQFGDTHKIIINKFTRAQLFGFTGTPILRENSINNRTTKDLFHERLHEYIITNAIRDENVLRFSVEYWGSPSQNTNQTSFDKKVRDIDVKGFYEHQKRIDGVVDWVIKTHDQKTHNREFSAIMCVGSVDALTRVYDTFRRKRKEGQHDLKVATIFTCAPNEEDVEADGLVDDPDVTGGPVNAASQGIRNKLASYVSDYNQMFGENASVADQKAFYSYYNSLAKRMNSRDRKNYVKDQGIDILLVVNMFLTGFDAKTVNTLYVDKNLRYHGLIQAFSRTNRILGQKKSQGNIVCFRNLKDQVDEAVALFSNKDAHEEVLMASYEIYVARFNQAVAELLEVTPTPDDVELLKDENEDLIFVQAFRKLMRLHNTLFSFTQASFDDLSLCAQAYQNFKGKYLDMHDKVKGYKDSTRKASIIDEVDFELELIRRDNINVAYILALLTSIADVQNDPSAEHEVSVRTKAILDALGGDDRLRSKKDLIEEFIASYLPRQNNSKEAKDTFEAFWDERRSIAFNQICAEEELSAKKFRSIIEDYLFSGKEPLSQDIADASIKPLGVLDRRQLATRVTQRLRSYVHTFDENMGDLEAA